MSGDVQPRKRKDKKRKKDELGIEEPRGTAAVFGEGDVFMHSQHEHGTGGHWCAKIIFFSLLAILMGLIGLIILENRGLTELEANAIESRYSGVLEGWLEEAPEDDHHDEHTLDLNHADEHEEDEEDNDDVEVEKIEQESEDLELISAELLTSHEETDNESHEKYANEMYLHENGIEAQEDDEDKNDFSQQENTPEDNDSEPVVVESISSPSGKPYHEIEESSEQLPADTLAEEEEYERRQEELRREEEKASHLWLKLSVGAALLLATHAVVRRAVPASTSTHGTDGSDKEEIREGTPPVVDRRMTLLFEESAYPVEPKTVTHEKKIKTQTKESEGPVPVVSQPMAQLLTQEIENDEALDEEEPKTIDRKSISSAPKRDTPEKELYSEEDEDLVEEEDKNMGDPSTEFIRHESGKQEDTDEVPDDVEIIDEELEDEEEGEEEEISDVDDAELLSRLEAKYGRLPGSEQREQRNKEGGNSVEDWWPGEPSEPQWRRQLDHAENQLNQEYEY